MLKIFLLIILAAVLIIYLVLYLIQDKLVFRIQDINTDNLKTIRKKFPDAEMKLTTPDSVTLHGWFVENKSAEKSPLLIYFGGNAEEVSYVLLDDIQRYKGWSVAFFNYRGYGLSQGEPSDENLYKDALFLYDQLSARDDVDTSKIVAMGRSLGTGVAGYLAHKRTLRAVILVTPYDSVESVAKERYPFVPMSIFLKNKFNSLTYAPNIETPMLALIAENDRTIPPHHADTLIEHWNGAVQKYVIPDVGHNNIVEDEQYWQIITEYLKDIKNSSE